MPKALDGKSQLKTRPAVFESFLLRSIAGKAEGDDFLFTRREKITQVLSSAAKLS